MFDKFQNVFTFMMRMSDEFAPGLNAQAKCLLDSVVGSANMWSRVLA